jgi:hypothetical protein
MTSRGDGLAWFTSSSLNRNILTRIVFVQFFFDGNRISQV